MIRAGRVAAVIAAGMAGLAPAASAVPPPNNGAREFKEAEFWLQMGRTDVGIPLLDRSCTLGHGLACTYLGLIYLQEFYPTYGAYESYLMIVPNYDGAIRTLERGCELGQAYACARRGHMLRTGTGGATDREGALGFYERACALNHAESCQVADELR
ncbi:hypothetical protein [Hyphomonas sp.]|uniref:hypothetical protein n=1 Tax=Hyphomonas sp. TaxID=87 RepID=UPI00391BF29A